MPNEFYAECSLLGSTGKVNLAELACERTASAYDALAKNLGKMYRAGDGNRIKIALRKATPSDIAEVGGLLQAIDNPSLRAAWADAAVRLASGTQNTQFNPEDCAPEEWVNAIEAAGIGGARWRDASWGNNAAPSWELVDSNQVLAEAFFYTVQNAERHTKRYGGQSHILVLLFDDKEDSTSGFETSPAAFLNIIEEAANRDALPRDALNAAARRACDKALAFWSKPG